jgi:hypothetical protein
MAIIDIALLVHRSGVHQTALMFSGDFNIQMYVVVGILLPLILVNEKQTLIDAIHVFGKCGISRFSLLKVMQIFKDALGSKCNIFRVAIQSMAFLTFKKSRPVLFTSWTFCSIFFTFQKSTKRISVVVVLALASIK